MSPNHLIALTDGLTLVGLLPLPAYSVYWLRYHLRGERWRRLWLGGLALLAWGVATYVCFIRLVLGCLGGGCADKVSPFLEFSIIYAVSSTLLIFLLHWYRASPRE